MFLSLPMKFPFFLLLPLRCFRLRDYLNPFNVSRHPLSVRVSRMNPPAARVASWLTSRAPARLIGRSGRGLGDHEPRSSELSELTFLLVRVHNLDTTSHSFILPHFSASLDCRDGVPAWPVLPDLVRLSVPGLHSTATPRQQPIPPKYPTHPALALRASQETQE